jgi:hypothetical protein
MKPVMQTIFTNEDETVHGNCLSACLASLLEMQIDEVPAFNLMGGEWGIELYNFLQKHDYTSQGTGYAQNGIEKLEKYEGIDGYVIVQGKSFREYVTRGHAVIYYHGKLAHDPHPSKLGLKEVEDWLMIEKIPPSTKENNT